MKTSQKSHPLTSVLAVLLTLTLTTWSFAACSNQPDAPDCPCFDDTGAWAPTGAYIQDIALDTLGTKESCPCPGTTGCNWEISPTDPFSNAGKPYYQMVLGANSELAAMLMSWALSYCGPILPRRQAWCSETISYWHREAGIPYSNGYQTCGWYCDWQVYNVGDLRTWYETEDYVSPMGSGRGRWISHDELDYANFQLGVTVPVPGSYVGIRGYTLGNPNYWQGLENSHSLMINEMWVHKDILGNVFQIEVTLLEGNSGNRVRDDHSYEDLWSVTPAGPDWIGSDRKIYGFGVDLYGKRIPYYDHSRLHYVQHQNIHMVPGQVMAVIDKDWDSIARLIPQLRAYAELIREEDGPKLTCSTPAIKIPGIPDSNNIRWYFPKEIQGPVEILIDLVAVHPKPIRGIEISWDGQEFIPRNYQVQFAAEEKAYQDAMIPDLSNVQFPQQATGVPIPAYFSQTDKGVPVRFVKLIFPKGTFYNDALIDYLRFDYEQSPWEEAEDSPPCKNDIPGDINEDCIVDFRDFAIMASHWLEQSE